MSEKSKVVSFTPNIGSFDWNGKKLYNHVVVFENGKSGKCVTATQDGSPWKMGEEVEFTSETGQDGSNKIKRVQQAGGGFAGGKGGYKKNERLECASYSLSYAKDLACDKVITVKEILPLAEDMYAWLIVKGGVGEAPKTES